MRARPLLRLAGACAALLWAAASATLAGTIGLAWDAVPSAAGYRVYYGALAGQYTGVLDVGKTTAATIQSLADCTSWHVAVKAYNSMGESPEFSDEVSGWPRPAITGATPSVSTQGDVLAVEVQGANFQPNAAIELDNPHVLFQSAAAVSCTRIQMLMTIEPTAENVRPATVGSFSLTVVNPDEVFGSRSNAFEVRINPARFDLNQSDSATDGRIDGADTVWLARLFGGQEGGPLYDPDADFNGDGWVDGDDLAHIASNLGGCWTGSSWSAAACPIQ